MASADTRAAALLLFSVSAVLFFLLLLQRSPGLNDLVRSALDRFIDGRGLLELATRRNMILLCHAILLVILRDAGLLGAAKTARRRSRSVSPADAQAACSAAPARPHAHASATTVVWRRRPRNRAAAPTRLIESPQPASAWAAAPPLAEEPPVGTKQVALAVESLCRNKDDSLLDQHATVQQPDEPTATAMGGESECDRRIVVVADDKTKTADSASPEQEMELADDRTFEEFIRRQRRKMRQESLRLLRAGHQQQHQAIAT